MEEAAKESVFPKYLPQDVPGKLEIANVYKENGNKFFKDQLFKKAISQYGRSLAYTKGLPGSSRGLSGIGEMVGKAKKNKEGNATAEQEAKAIEIETAVQTNIATCYIKLAEPRKAIEHSDAALTLTQDYWKAMLRKAEAYIMLKNYDAAKEQLNSALKHVSDESWIAKINKEHSKIAALEKEESRKQKQAFSKIFDRSASDD